MSLNLRCVVCRCSIPEGRDCEHVTCCDYCEVFLEHHLFWGRVKVNHESGCMEWPVNLDTAGYGRVNRFGWKYPAHRVAYELFFGKIPAGLVIDHLCRNRACVNPAHLEAVTGKVNTLRGIGASAINFAKTHCKRGHVLAGINLSAAVKHGRICKVCNRERMRKRRHQQ